MALPRGYRSFADFEREELRPDMRIGWSVDEIDAPASESELDFDVDPFEASMWEAEQEAAEEDSEEDD
jgi:hypothetical protein